MGDRSSEEAIMMEDRPTSILVEYDYSADVRVTWLEVWERLDALNDGKISLKKLEDQLMHTRYADDLPPEAITNLLKQADINKDGYISKIEFLLLVQQSKRSPKYNQLLREAAFLIIPRSSRNVEIRRYVDEYSCRPPPLFMLTITLVEISVFIYYTVKMEEPVTSTGPVPVESPLIYNPNRRYEAWRFLTYMFIHAGWVHLMNNLIMQLFLGVILELVHKWWRVMLVYLAGVIAGSLASSIATPDYYLAGASGGVYALEYAYLGNLIINWSEMSFPIVQLLGLGILSLLDASFAVWDTYFNPEPSNTSYVAHLGGALAGVLIGVNVLRNLKKEPWEKYCWWICLTILVSLMGAAIIVEFSAPGYFPDPDYSSL